MIEDVGVLRGRVFPIDIVSATAFADALPFELGIGAVDSQTLITAKGYGSPISWRCPIPAEQNGVIELQPLGIEIHQLCTDDRRVVRRTVGGIGGAKHGIAQSLIVPDVGLEIIAEAFPRGRKSVFAGGDRNSLCRAADPQDEQGDARLEMRGEPTNDDCNAGSKPQQITMVLVDIRSAHQQDYSNPEDGEQCEQVHEIPRA